MADSAPPSLLADLEPCIDTNIYCGPYPYRPLPATDPEGLLSLLFDANIETALVTPFPALFHTRPWAGLSPWLSVFGDHPHVRFWGVVNPALPGWEDDLAAAIDTESVVGVRLFPRCHGYRPFAPALLSLLDRAAAHGLPVCLTARLLDDRLYPRMFRVDPPLDLEEVGALLKQFPSIPWVLTGFYMAELRTLKGTILASPKALVDIGLSKPFEPWWEDLQALFPVERLLLGTGAPLYYHVGTRLSLARSEMEPRARQRLLRGNALRLIHTPLLTPPEGNNDDDDR